MNLRVTKAQTLGTPLLTFCFFRSRVCASMVVCVPSSNFFGTSHGDGVRPRVTCPVADEAYLDRQSQFDCVVGRMHSRSRLVPRYRSVSQNPCVPHHTIGSALARHRPLGTNFAWSGRLCRMRHSRRYVRIPGLCRIDLKNRSLALSWRTTRRFESA